jgi:hypothetical protein
MTLISIEAVYEDGRIRLLEEPPTDRPYRVLITFVAPVGEDPVARRQAERVRAFQATAGTWQDERSTEAIVRDLREARESKLAPPEL